MKWVLTLLMVAAFGLIGCGVAMVHRPAALIVVGGLLWLELFVYGFLTWLARTWNEHPRGNSPGPRRRP